MLAGVGPASAKRVLDHAVAAPDPIAVLVRRGPAKNVRPSSARSMTFAIHNRQRISSGRACGMRPFLIASTRTPKFAARIWSSCNKSQRDTVRGNAFSSSSRLIRRTRRAIKEAVRSGPRVDIGARVRGMWRLASVGGDLGAAPECSVPSESGLPVSAKCFAGGRNGWNG